jgi:hypothetical protein
MRYMLTTNTLTALLVTFAGVLVYLAGFTGLLVIGTMASTLLLADALAMLKIADLQKMQRDLTSGNRGQNQNAKGGNGDNKGDK